MMQALLKDPFFFGEEILNTMHIFIGPWLDYCMIAITAMGTQLFYVVMLPLAYWLYDREITLKIGAVFLVSSVINDMTKEIFQNPRPDPAYLVDGIRELNITYKPKGPGFPSGHTQGALTFWGSIIYFNRTRVMIILSALLIILIPYSRIYLGVHYLGDVIGGYIIGALCLLVCIPLVIYCGKHYMNWNSVLIILGLIILPLAVFLIIPGYQTQQPLGVLSGMLLGAYMARDIIFNPRNTLSAGLVKVLIGLIGIFIIKSGVKIILPDSAIFSYIRYWLIGAWVSFAAPLIFSKVEMLKGKTDNC
ncbi:MAG: hypothetical protein CVV44_16015 [Spirochaetae bacterium HGW-Spirochaetae-1]|jgi:membrane-associated phospholipid phosphatase|nr:MAG: hypothetical protein CVV44_16015 [Spirochaetae bacterium HGW-Spirochaetae-1]